MTEKQIERAAKSLVKDCFVNATVTEDQISDEIQSFIADVEDEYDGYIDDVITEAVEKIYQDWKTKYQEAHPELNLDRIDFTSEKGMKVIEAVVSSSLKSTGKINKLVCALKARCFDNFNSEWYIEFRQLKSLVLRAAMAAGHKAYLEEQAAGYIGEGYDGYFAAYTQDPKIRQILYKHGHPRPDDEFTDDTCSFAVSVGGDAEQDLKIIVYTADFQKEVLKKYMESYDLDEKKIRRMLKGDVAVTDSFYDNYVDEFTWAAASIGIQLSGNRLVFKDMVGTRGKRARSVMDFLENLEWDIRDESRYYETVYGDDYTWGHYYVEK